MIFLCVCWQLVLICPIFSMGLAPRQNLSGVTEPNRLLTSAVRHDMSEIGAPESFAVSNGKMLTSTQLGVYEIFPFADPPKKPQFLFRMGEEPCGSLENETTCGRPLGLTVDAQGRFLVADAYLGISAYDYERKIKTPILNKAFMVKRKLKFLNGITTDDRGHIYFTSSSSKWDRRDYLKALIEGKSDGKVLMFHPTFQLYRVLINGLNIPNGILLTPNGRHLLISETGGARILKYNLRTKQLKTLIDLPLIPDNIKFIDKSGDTFWVTGAARRDLGAFSFLDTIQQCPASTAELLKLPQGVLLPPYGLILEINSTNGQIIRSMHDPEAKKVFAISEAYQWNNTLFLGSYHNHFYATLNLSKNPY